MPSWLPWLPGMPLNFCGCRRPLGWRRRPAQARWECRILANSRLLPALGFCGCRRALGKRQDPPSSRWMMNQPLVFRQGWSPALPPGKQSHLFVANRHCSNCQHCQHCDGDLRLFTRFSLTPCVSCDFEFYDDPLIGRWVIFFKRLTLQTLFASAARRLQRSNRLTLQTVSAPAARRVQRGRALLFNLSMPRTL